MKQLFAAVLPLRLAQRQRLQNRHDVLLDCHFAKNRFFLRQITHPEPRALVHWIIGNVRAGKNDAATVWPNESDNHVKGRRLAGAVRAQQADDLAGAGVDVDSIDDRAAAINFYELVGGKNMVGLRFRSRCNWRTRTSCSLADHGVPDALGEGAGLVSFCCSSVFGSWRISWSITQCGVSWTYYYTIL